MSKVEKQRNDLHNGDCLELMPSIAAGSVDAIICDPPYGTMKGAEGTNKYGSKDAPKHDWDNELNHDAMLVECNRLLRPNGALVLFGQDPYTAKLMTNTHGNLPFSYRYTWKKDSFAFALGCKKAPVNYTEDVCVFFKKYDTLNQHPLRGYSRKVLQHTCRSLKDINQDLGHRRAEHFFYTDSTQFGLCTEAVYAELVSRYGLQYAEWFLPYTELEEINRRFNRRFNLPDGAKYKSNVLEYRKDYRGEHPTQKPVALMEDLVRTYTNEGDTVLDFTMGSGTTGVSCVNEGRNFIGIEKDAGYYDIARDRISNAENGEKQGELTI